MTFQLLTFAQGSEDVGTITLAGVTIDGSGVGTAGSSKTIFGYLSTIKNSYEATTEEVSAVTSDVDNNIKLSGGTSYDITTLLKYGDSVGSPVNAPRDLTGGFDYLELIYQLAGVTWTYVGLVKNYVEDVVDKGRIPASFQLIMVDIGSANPAMS